MSYLLGFVRVDVFADCARRRRWQLRQRRLRGQQVRLLRHHRPHNFAGLGGDIE